MKKTTSSNMDAKKTVTARFAHADQLTNRGRYRDAIAIYEMLEKNPHVLASPDDRMHAMIMHGICLHGHKKSKAAADKLRQARMLGSQNPTVNITLAHVLITTKADGITMRRNRKEAEEYLEIATAKVDTLDDAAEKQSSQKAIEKLKALLARKTKMARSAATKKALSRKPRRK